MKLLFIINNKIYKLLITDIYYIFSKYKKIINKYINIIIENILLHYIY